MLASGSFSLKWETGRSKTVFPALKAPPFRLKERTVLAKSMSYDQLLNISVSTEDQEEKRRNRWKALRNTHLITQSPPFHKHSFETALYTNANHILSEEHFVMTIMNEYKFPNSMKMDAHLRWLYWSFDHERENNVDWRDVLLHYKILMYFRWVKDRTCELILILFNIYVEGENKQIAFKDDFVLKEADQALMKIFLAPCVLETEIVHMKNLAEDMMIKIQDKGNTIIRRQFQKMLSDYNPKLLQYWSRLMWELLPSDMRLTVLDESQMHHHDLAENIIARFKYEQALNMYKKNTSKVFFREWKLHTLRSTGVRAYANKKLRRKLFRFFTFWQKLARRRTIRHRRKTLAETIGTYAIKARCFARIKLFIQNYKRIEGTIGIMHARGRYFKLAGTHLREFRRINNLRIFYHRWWNKCVEINNHEVAVDADRKRLFRWVFFPWFKYAHARAEEERQEVIARENKLQFDRMLKEAEEATQLLIRLEKEREDRLKAQEAERQRQEKEQRLIQARKRIQKEKEDERRIVLNIQKEERMKRIAKDIKQLKSQFKKAFERKAKDLLLRAKDRTTGYIENPDNKLALDMKFEVLKKEFFANPSPETRERERILSSYRNIMFLFIDAKLRADGVEMKDLIPRFDASNKGYLTYAEFAALVRSLKTSLSEAQINGVIRSIDDDRDGYITLGEIAVGMAEIDKMGIVGSPWKMYIDPAEDVICYHNFITGQKILEYQMTDKELRSILLVNMYAEAEEATLAEIKTLREKNWQETLQNYMARRMQYMYRVWKARRWRQKKAWKVEKRELRLKNDLQKVCVRFMERSFIGYKSRVIFKKQLQLTIEKVYDVASKQIFYYNHVTKESSWVKPHLIRRYGDVTNPCVWIPLDQTSESAVESSDGQQQYWHVTAKRAFPKKPDGYLICGQCNYLMAIHKCKTCLINYCFACHRSTHANPLGFCQNTKAKKEEYTDPNFIIRMNNFKHFWSTVEVLRCQLCKTSKIYAAYSCQECDKNLCRQCFNRLHPADMKKPHHFTYV